VNSLGVDYAREENNRPLLISDPATYDRDRALRINSIIPQTPFFTLDKFGAFSQLRWDLSDRWIASGGLRYDRFGFSVGDFDQIAFRAPGQRFGGTTTNESVSANAGIVYKVTPEVNLFASYAQGFALPDLFNAFSSLNPGA
jgi:iron complex outermembrane recepter protein